MSETPLDDTPARLGLDVITIGRSSVDLYGTQVGGRLEDMRSFNKYVGGSPTNMAVGVARLGLRPALITRVGDEHMGRFLREELTREGVDTRGVKTDPERLTALVILGIRDEHQFPLIFYRENCADMALSEDDIDPALIAEAGCVTVTGTHLSNPQTRSAVVKAVRLARENGARTALDIDFRPNLWGLAGHGEGEERFIESSDVTGEFQSTLVMFDLIVGTEDEFHIAGGSTDTLEALANVRALSKATLVCKRGPMGASAFERAIPGDIEEGITGPGFPIEVFNVLGAGDGFMAGLLRGWLRDEDWQTTLTYANACGAIAVSRHGCAPSYPSWEELQWFLEHGSSHRALRKDEALAHIHWATTRRVDWPEMRVFAFDHRGQLEKIAADAGASPDRISDFKLLCLQAAQRVASGQTGHGILCDSRLGRAALHAAAGSGLWIGRPTEVPGSRPLELEIGPDLGSDLAEWPAEHVVKVLCFHHPDDDKATLAAQEDTVVRLADAARSNGLEFLLEIIPSAVQACDRLTTARSIRRFYQAGVRPDWWKLEPMKDDDAWKETCAAITENDPWCRGIVVLGLGAEEGHLRDSFTAAARHPLVKGFAVGRTIFAHTARSWFAGEIDDDVAIAQMETRFRSLRDLWDELRHP